MSSFLERAKIVIEENRDLLAVFEEYDKTHVFKLPSQRKGDFEHKQKGVKNVRAN